MTLVHVQPCMRPSAQSSYHDDVNRRGLGYRIDANWSPKAVSEKAQTTVSENRYISPRIDFFWTIISSFLVSTGNNVRASFSVKKVPHIPPLQSCDITSAYVYTNFFSAFECPIIPVVHVIPVSMLVPPFLLKGEVHKFQSFQCGLAPAPLLFTKLLKPLLVFSGKEESGLPFIWIIC